jgi:hypothetical protein
VDALEERRVGRDECFAIEAEDAIRLIRPGEALARVVKLPAANVSECFHLGERRLDCPNALLYALVSGVWARLRRRLLIG